MLRGRPSGSARDLAIADGKATYFTGKQCIRGHVCERTVLHRHCVECERGRHRKATRTVDPAKQKVWAKRWREKTPEKQREYRRKYYLANQEKHKQSSKRWRDKAKPWLREERREYARTRARKATVALRALKELGIEV